MQQKKRGSPSVDYLKNHPQILLITILIGNNIVNILLPVLSTLIFTRLFGDHIIGILTGVLTLILLLFGEIIPKAFAQKHHVRFSLISAPLIYGLSRLLFPLVWLLDRLLRSFGAHEKINTFSDEELLAFAKIGEEEGGLEEEERERIENVLEFGEQTVQEVMTPRPEMDIIEQQHSLEEAIQFFLERTHSRIPVYEKDVDHIVGILTLKDILQYERSYEKETLIADLPKKMPLMIPMSMPLTDLLQQMKWKRTHMAIVVDEHGSTLGLVTLEDLLEEIVGEIQDETDEEVEPVKKLSDTHYLVQGNAELEEIRALTNFDIAGEESDTIAKVVLDSLGRFPKRGEDIMLSSSFSVIIEKMEGHRIVSLRLISDEKR